MVINKKAKGFAKAFLLSGFIAMLVLLVQAVMGKGIMLYAGDFNAQQIPFNYYVNHFLENGGGTFSWATDLGSSFINSYSFYVLGSPFYWLVNALPASAMPYMMYPLLVLKFAVMGGGVYLWSEKYVKDDNWAIAAALLYVFSGYSMLNIFFNHFIDVVAFFPYLLWALDEAMLNERKGLFAIFVGINFLINYFFFFGEVVFLFIYFVCGILTGSYELDIKKFIRLAFESLLGCALACVLVLPAFICLSQTNRASSFLPNGLGYLSYTYGEHYIALLMNLFLAPDRCFSPSIFTKTKIGWTSMSMYIPAFSMSGVIAYFVTTKGQKDQWKKIFTISIVCMFIPFLNTIFTFLNSTYYARWFYMPLLIAVLMTVKALQEHSDDVMKYLIYISAGSAFLLVLFHAAGVEANPTTLGAIFLPSILCSAKMLSTLHFFKGREELSKKVITSLMFCCLLFGWTHCYLTGQYSANNIHRSNIVDGQLLSAEMPEHDIDYRIDTYSTAVNNPNLYNDLPTVKTFNSTVESSIINFYDSLGYARNTRFEESLDHQALYTFLNTKYTIVNKVEKISHTSMRENLDEEREKYLSEEDWTAEKAAIQIFDLETRTDYKFLKEAANHLIYENLNYAGVGFVYDDYLTKEEFDKLPQPQKEYALLKTVVLKDEDVEKYGQYFDGLFDIESVDYTEEQMKKDIEKLKENNFDIFTMTNTGFTASYELDNEELVVLSVPYSKNWTITVDNEPAEFIEVDSGMLGVVLPSGKHIMIGNYVAAGEKEGRLISIAALLILIAYFGYIYYDNRKNPQMPGIYKELEAAIMDFENYDDGLDFDDDYFDELAMAYESFDIEEDYAYDYED